MTNNYKTFLKQGSFSEIFTTQDFLPNNETMHLVLRRRLFTISWCFSEIHHTSYDVIKKFYFLQKLLSKTI